MFLFGIISWLKFKFFIIASIKLTNTVANEMKYYNYYKYGKS